MRWGMDWAGGDASVIAAFRHNRIRQESPRGLFRVGAAVFAISVVNYLLGMMSLHVLLQHTALSIATVASAEAIRKEKIQDGQVVWLLAACAAFGTLLFQYEVWRHPDVSGLVYANLALFGLAFILDVRAFLVAGGFALLGFTAMAYATSAAWGKGSVLTWTMCALTAEVIAFLLMLMRMQSIDELGGVTRLAEGLARRDRLTGLLNRHGVEMELPRVVARARLTQSPVYIVFIDIDGLKGVNDVFGHEVGDAVIHLVSNALAACSPRGAVNARWGGDEFLSIWVGTAPDVAAVTEELHAAIASSDLVPERWHGHVSVGIASGNVDDFDALVSRADAHMYERRANRA